MLYKDFRALLLQSDEITLDDKTRGPILVIITLKDVDYIADAFETKKYLNFPNIPKLALSQFLGYSHVLVIQTTSVWGIHSCL